MTNQDIRTFKKGEQVKVCCPGMGTVYFGTFVELLNNERCTVTYSPNKWHPEIVKTTTERNINVWRVK